MAKLKERAPGRGEAQGPERLRVLLVEDTEDDAILLLRVLRRAGLEVHSRRVQDESSLRAALAETWDIVLCDYAMPELDAARALAIIAELTPDLPVIVVSGTMGEETAVEVMRLGARDYLLKDKLDRLAVAVARDVREATVRAERRRAERTQQSVEAGFRLIVERSPDLVVVHRNEAILYANPAVLTRLGYAEASEIVGQPISSLVAEGYAPELAPSERPGPFTELWRTKSDERVAVEVVRQSISFEGQPSILKIARDATERNEIAAAMVEMDRMAAIGILAAAVGHEINNPLAYVLANLEYVSTELEAILAEIPRPVLTKIEARFTDLRQAVADMSHGARRVRDIVQDLRTFSRGDDDKVTMVDVRQVLDSSLRMGSVQVPQQTNVVKTCGEVPFVLANESRLGQVFLNLVVNAAQALHADSNVDASIKISTRFEAGMVVVVFEDNGSGIPPSALPRIFEPFFTTKPAGHGTGLGLAICRRIVRALGGEIEVTSELGHGTAVTVRLPPASPGAVGDTPPPAPVSEGPVRRGRVLCVDDEPALGIALRRLLIADHDVVVLTSAVAARERILEGETFDVILCDLHMPGMTGMELHAELVRHAPDLVPRMIFLTGAAFTPQGRAFLEKVPNPRLEKPIGIEELRTTICRILESEAPRPSPTRRPKRSRG